MANRTAVTPLLMLRLVSGRRGKTLRAVLVLRRWGAAVSFLAERLASACYSAAGNARYSLVVLVVVVVLGASVVTARRTVCWASVAGWEVSVVMYRMQRCAYLVVRSLVRILPVGLGDRWVGLLEDLRHTRTALQTQPGLHSAAGRAANRAAVRMVVVIVGCADVVSGHNLLVSRTVQVQMTSSRTGLEVHC